MIAKSDIKNNQAAHTVCASSLSSTTLSLEGQTIEIKGTEGLLAHRPYAWIPSAQAIVGNVGVFGQMHVWTADTQSPAERQAWVAQLDEMSALKPRLVVPGHMKSGTPLDASTIRFTRDYLQAFDQAAASSANSAELIGRMKMAYPDAVGGLSLDIGAKVRTGEMKW